MSGKVMVLKDIFGGYEDGGVIQMTLLADLHSLLHNNC